MNGTAECWVLSDDKPGMRNQCVGLAEALGVDFVVKTIRPRLPWRMLPPQLWLSPLSAQDVDGDALRPPWPELLIATGRQTVALALAIKRASAGRTFIVQIQNPAFALSRFDLVVAPRHDGVSGANVIVTEGALHRVTDERLAREAAARLADGLQNLVRRHGAGLAITTSRRTGEENERLLRDALSADDAYFWDGGGDNPYFGFLGLCDAIVATSDSVSMVSEACATGKPVHVFDLDGGSEKFRRFHRNLRQREITRPFTGEIESWSYETLDDTGLVARAIRRRMRQSVTSD